MTHYAVLMQALNAHGRTTYPDLVEQHAGAGYTYAGFVGAVRLARRRGVVAPIGQRGVIIKAAHCPCCGQALEGQ